MRSPPPPCSQKCWVLLFAFHAEIRWGCELSPNICSLEWRRRGEGRWGWDGYMAFTHACVVHVLGEHAHTNTRTHVSKQLFKWVLCILLNALLAAPRKQNPHLCNCTQSKQGRQTAKQVHGISTFCRRKLFGSQMHERAQSRAPPLHESLCKSRKIVKSDKQKNWKEDYSITGVTELSASASCRVRKSLTWSIDSIPLSTGEDITCILCIKLILGQLNYNKLRRNPLIRDHFECNTGYIDTIYALSLLMPRGAAQENWNSCSHQPAWSRRQCRIKEKLLASFITNDVCWVSLYWSVLSHKK